MFELTCSKCRVENDKSLTCQACAIAYEFKVHLQNDKLYQQVLRDANSLIAYHASRKVTILRGNVSRSQKNDLKKLIFKSQFFCELKKLCLGDFAIYIETINVNDEMRTLMYLPEAIAEEQYCFIKI